MSNDLTRIIRRARLDMARHHAQALDAKGKAQLRAKRHERHARRSLVEAYRLADLAEV